MVNGYIVALVVHICTCILLALIDWLTQRKIRGFQGLAMAYVMLASAVFVFLITDDVKGLLAGVSFIILITLTIFLSNHPFTKKTLIIFLCLIPVNVYLLNTMMHHALINYSNIMTFIVSPLTIVMVKREDLRSRDKFISTLGLLVVFFAFFVTDFDNLLNTAKPVVMAEDYLEEHYEGDFQTFNFMGGFRGSSIEMRFHHDSQKSIKLLYQDGTIVEVLQ